MTSCESASASFEALSRELLNRGLTVRFEARGASMSPVIRDREIVYVTPVMVGKLRKGDIVLTKGHSGFRVHRLVHIETDKNIFITRGDCGRQDDPPVDADQILGVVLAKEVRLGRRIVPVKLKGIHSQLLQGAARGQRGLSKLVRFVRERMQRMARTSPPALDVIIATLVLCLAAAPLSHAQVVVDASTSVAPYSAAVSLSSYYNVDAIGAAGTVPPNGGFDTASDAFNSALLGTSLTYNGLTVPLGPANALDAVANKTITVPAGIYNSITLFASTAYGPATGQSVVLNYSDGTSSTFTQSFSDWGNSQGYTNETVASSTATRITPSGTTQSGPWYLYAYKFTPTAGKTVSSVTLPATRNIVCFALYVQAGDITGPGTISDVFNHTTTTSANRLLLVGVSLNISNSPSSTVSSVTYNGSALTRLGAHNDANNTRRVEQWYLLNPAAGSNLPVNVSINVPTAATVGVIAGATTFTGVDQTVPLSSFVFADGAAGSNSPLDVPSVINGMIFDTLAVASNAAIIVSGPQAQQWNLTSGNLGAATDVNGSASTRSGAPSVPISEIFGATSNWSMGAVSINPSGADIGVTTSVNSAVFVGQNTTYTMTITNNGPSAANNVVITDNWGDTGLTADSVTTSSGITCQYGSPFSCNLPTPFAPGATATVTLTVTASAAGNYPNTAVVTDSGTPPDPNTGNNTYVSVATVQAATCAAVTQQSPGNNLSGVLNAYYPGTASVAAGATSIPVGTATGTGAIAAGNLLLVIQMQDASINDSNTVAFGNGYTGQGFTVLNSAGEYEFVTATGPVSGGSVPIAGAGGGGGLVFAYHASAWSASAGQSTYQVVVVPQYSNATFNATSPPTATAWNGSTGGVLALDVAGTLTLNGATAAVDGLGFRGGAGMQLSGGSGAITDYWHSSPSAYTGAAGGVAGVDAAKGEGIAGTPEWVESNQTFLKTSSGYPSGTAGTDGSMARGAAGNAGGGGTDGDPVTNDQNAGGGGGGNGGGGGFGGDSWSSNFSVGGEGGAVFPATINRMALGGGGGAGTRNNSDGDNQASGGAAGGGIIIVRTELLSGTGTLTANGQNAYVGTSNDAGGGGGAGGTIVVLSNKGGESGLTLQANGGAGASAWQSQPYSLSARHGPGGGGGGGVVLVSGTPASLSVAGGANGLTLTPGVPYGSTPGTAGFTATNQTIAQTSGTLSAAQCTPDMTLGKSHVGNFTRGSTAAYTIPVSNLSQYGASTGTVTVNDTLPTGLMPTGASGTGWTCSVASQTVSCVDATSLAASGAYPSITINANVLQTAPSTETNVATVGGGGEANLTNDTATDVATVVSSADLGVSNAASPNPVAAGSNITYMQTVTDIGPSAADNATLVEAIPANSTFVSLAVPAGWSCVTPAVGGIGNLVCTDLSLNGGTAATFALVTQVNSGTATGTVITDTAMVSSSASDPNSANNTASASTVVGANTGANMVVTDTASPNPVVAGSNITYTQVSTNIGSTTANNPSLTETTPPNTTFVSLSSPPGTTCTTPAVGGTGTITCTAPSAPAGSSGTVTLVVQIAAATASGTVINNTVTVTSSNQSLGSNSATATDVVASSSTQADVALSTAATPNYVYAGNDITYVQTVSNNGPAASSNVNFLEAVPTNTTFASVSAPAGWTCTTPAVGATGNVSCTDSSLASGSSADIIVVVNLASTVTASSITANSSVSATTSDPNSANNSTTITTPVYLACDLSVTNAGSPNTATAGGNITYTQVVGNSGPASCATATFTEAIPANTTFVSIAAPTGWTCTTSGSISCTNPSVASGSTGTFTVKVLVTAGTAQNTIITDTATVASATHDTNTANNTATVTTGVAGATEADLSVTNSATASAVAAGGNITYTQTVTNNGPATAGGTSVTLTDPLPAGATYVSLTGPAGWTCGFSSPNYVCTIASLAANASASFTFMVNVPTTVASGTTLTQTDTVSASPTTDPNPNNNSASASVVVAASADLSVTNTASPVPVQAGNNITYTQVATNAGPSVATSASLTETTPANTTFQSISIAAGWSCTTPAVGSAGTITCTNPSFAAGSANFSVVLGVAAGTAAGTAINDTAVVSSSTTDTNSANNSATASDVVATSTQADLIVTNSATPASVAPGANVTYTQSVKNNGPASATSPTFKQSTPPNTVFESITPPSGWTCTTPAVASAGTITCTDGSSLAANATANFSLALQVNSSTVAGTNIAETATASSTNVVPNLTSNTAIATVVVAGSTSADLAIVKTAVPAGSVPSGDVFEYILAVTNNGPASATNVTVTDPLPSDLTYLVALPSVGTCSEAGGTVTCLLGTMANAATATITIFTISGSPGTVTNTATVSELPQNDPNLTNNTSSETEIITGATAVKLKYFVAQHGKDKSGTDRVILRWSTGDESHNFGFNVYREHNGEHVRLNPSIVAGSALLMTGASPRHSGKTYAWIDSSAAAGSAPYWLEDIDVNGTRTLHGPANAKALEADSASDSVPDVAAMLSQLNQSQPIASGEHASHRTERISETASATKAQRQKQFQLAASLAVKIFVKHEGWYRVTQPELIKSGLDPDIDPALLHLYAEAIEQPIQIVGATSGPGGFGPQAALYFYGTAIDTQYSGMRVYWLVSESSPGERIQRLPSSVGSNPPPSNFRFSVETTPRTTYFSALINPQGNNFFGPLVSNTALDQSLQVSHLDMNSTESSYLDVSLQGVVQGYPHEVSIALNGSSVGTLTFMGQTLGKIKIEIPSGILQDGANTVTLTSEDGEYDTSLVQTIRITYPHAYSADSEALIFTGRPGDEIQVTGFDQANVGVIDITDPLQPIELTPEVGQTSKPGDYAMNVQIPWSSTNAPATNASAAFHTLLALTSDRISSPVALIRNHPSHWHTAQAGADEVIISAEPFTQALGPILRAHEAQGESSVVVPVSELYDEFSFGQHSPYAIRDFLQNAVKAWSKPPKYLLLNGRASLDPRNYLGFGHLDFVPTKIIPTSALMTASDDWFSDFTDSGLPTIATGRLPVTTLAEAELLAGKIGTYEGETTNGPWNSQALMVADLNDTLNFTQYAQMVQAELPPSMQVTDVFASSMTVPEAQQAILDAINSGQSLVNYTGHGSEDQWSGTDLFDNSSANSLTNGSSLPVFLIMNCLNGFFQDVYEEPLAVTLMLAPNGGAVAVLASSGLNQAPQQIQLDKLVVQNAMRPPQQALGDAVIQGKAGITDLDVRKTYILFGDPEMRIKPPNQNQ